MLVECTIKNLAVIESIHVRFYEGFHVITGETGAGKSMLIDALGLIAGGRASSEWVRYGEDRAEIECLFELPAHHTAWALLQEWGIDQAECVQLVIRREITKQGKSISRINGQFVNLSMLKQLGQQIINIHGQHEHQSLLHTDQHIHLLDAFCDKRIEKLKQKYTSLYDTYLATKRKLEELRQHSQQNLQMIDLFRFQVEEIQKAELKSGEDEWLQEEKQKLANAEKLVQSSSAAYESLNGSRSALAEIQTAMQKVEGLIHVDEAKIRPIHEQITSAYYQLEDAAFSLRDYRDSVEFNPVRLDEIENRLASMQSLKRKYGATIDDILQHFTHIQEQLDQLEHKDERIHAFMIEMEEQEKELRLLAEDLTKLRTKGAHQLSKQVEQHLKDLQMGRTRFEVNMDRKKDGALSKDGQDDVEFMISANPGEPVRPLSKIASGGEMSRIMLALKSIFADVDEVPVLIFDEVDTGVSGRAAQAIAEKMSRLASQCQVFSITHLPQVACMADVHYEIAKHVARERTFTEVKMLDTTQRIQELARMLGGVEVTETTEEHAKEMLDMAAQKKQSWNHLQ
ncbi:DNA repair protein RecN [Marinicrinis sediminis]|uniref:DNA repair protein RecN n=1 Tax=Marinicrinis sediminis TaxID=1652465 RepID=A0ABW5RCK0_9BACL